MPRRRREAPRPGPRPGEANLAPERLMDVARRLAPEDLVIRQVAREAGYTPQVPMHVFGSQAGLHAVLALEGFEELNRSLNRAARKSAEDQEVLCRLAVAYLEFGLEGGTRWRTMHSQRLWLAMGDPEERKRAEGGTWLSKHSGGRIDGHIFDAIVAERHYALEVFERAAKASGRPDVHDLVRTLTALIDGLLWQTHFEHVAVQRERYAALIQKVISNWR